MLSQKSLQSLRGSGLTDATIAAARIEDGASNPLIKELLESFHAKAGYYIPYPTLKGAFGEKPHYRIRVLERDDGEPVGQAKYLQGKKAPNHLYVPPRVLLPSEFAGWELDSDVPLFITEGEKKALAGAQGGLPIVGVGGVYSWRTNVYKLPRTAVKLEDTPSSKLVTLDAEKARLIESHVVEELNDIKWQNREVYLVFDSDAADKPQVQLACVDFALWLLERGALPRQVLLPPSEDGDEGKVGLDDFLLSEDASDTLLDVDWLTEHSVFPLPHDIRAYLAKLMNDGRMSRSLAEKLATISLAALDNWGERFRDATGQYYYFDKGTRALHEFRLDLPRLRESTFGQLLRNELGLGTSDSSVLSRLADDYVAGAHTVIPRRAISHGEDQGNGEPPPIYFQVDDGSLARVTSERIELVDNGTDDQLFLAGSVEPLPAEELQDAVEVAEAAWPPKKPRWLVALESVNLAPMEPLSLGETRNLLTCLFYMSPWLYRWKGTMLPLEVAVAEPNSGKTFLYNLRKGVLTGRPALSGLPNDFKDWVSAVASAGALWVCDNLGNVRSDYWHRFTDEVARLITDPVPSVDLRQLYTTSNLLHVPVQCSFAVTTVKNPFSQPDILQRALVYHLHAIPVNQRDSSWYDRQLADRAGFVAEHLVVLRRFLGLAASDWDDTFLSGFRLANFEQALLLMGETLGLDLTSVVDKLPAVVSETVAEHDPVMEAFRAFAAEWKGKTARFQDVVDWVQNDMAMRYSSLKQFDNVILLGRYVKSHEYDISQATGMFVTKPGNVNTFNLKERA